MSNTATRLITLIMLLQSRPNQKAAELAGRLRVSVRTLHRYMAMLDDMGIPIYSERGPYGGFSLVRGYRMPPLVFTPEEAVAVHLGVSLVGETWGDLYRGAAHGALAKLDAVLPEEQRHEVAWARRTLVLTQTNRANLDLLAPFLEKLRRSVRERRRVRLAYRTRGRPDAPRRDVDIYALVHRWGWWYAIGFCHMREALRSFRVDRMDEVTLLESGFEIPADFDVHAYLEAEFRGQTQVSVKMRFSPAAAELAWGDRSTWSQIEEQPDGSVDVVLTTPDLDWAASMGMSYGPIVTVLDPPELRRRIAERAQEVAEMYAETSQDGDEQGRMMQQGNGE
jgi:predicted DNA-binding transcriptional regulator YafY